MTKKHKIREFLNLGQATINTNGDDQEELKPHFLDCDHYSNDQHLSKSSARDDHSSNMANKEAMSLAAKKSISSNNNNMTRVGMGASISEAEQSHEVTMRRARVSVRARSEASMVRLEKISANICTLFSYA